MFSQRSLFQEALQFYDTPRNVREAMERVSQLDGMGNYDIPQAGVLPVFRKPCGCVLKLRSEEGGETGQVLTWSCVKEESELKIPRVKLTGQGKMPVVDMSKINANASRCFSEPPRPQSPQSPQYKKERAVSPPQALYAQVNKTRKTSNTSSTSCRPGDPTQTPQPNYTNLEFANSLPLYENSRDLLSRIPPPPPPPLRDKTSPDYLNMSPRRRENYEMMQLGLAGDKPLIGFSPVKFDNLYPLCESIESMAIMCDSDSKFNTIKQMPKTSKTVSGSSETDKVMSSSYHGGDQTNLIALINTNNVLSSGYVTIPRTRLSDNVLTNVSRSSSTGTSVNMRRSASVPCKRDRDSTSSGGSDSGVSTGSPRQSITDQMEFIK